MKRLAALSALVLVLSSCMDGVTDVREDVPAELIDVQLDLVDGANGQGGNAQFFFLRPLTDTKKVESDADPTLQPTVEVCLRNAAGDGCEAGQPPLITFERDAEAKKERIKVDGKGHYSAKWYMKQYQPQRDGVYRIRVLLQGAELGHADVVTMRKKEIKAFDEVGEDVIPISDKGTFKIDFFLGEGVLEEQFCDFDGDGDVEDCDAGVEDPTDGEPTVLTVLDGNEVAAVVTAPDGVFVDAQGNPIPDVVFTAEVEITPPSQDLILDDTQEHPYFVEINTFPNDVYIDTNGPGVSVVICQDDASLLARGIPDPLHPQLILYKVTDPKPGFPAGETKRLASAYGAPECNNPPPSPRTQGILGVIGAATTAVGGFFAPEPVSARRLHGGLNTVVRRDISSADAAFSTFGATLGPSAAQSTAVVPNGVLGSPTQILVEARTALGDLLQFGGDLVAISITAGPNTGAPVTVTDNGNGTYSASYVPAVSGTDELTITLTTADGWAQGQISGSPFSSVVDPPIVAGVLTNPNGVVALAASWDPAGGPLVVTGGNDSYTCSVQQPAGTPSSHSFCYPEVNTFVGSTYTLTTNQGSTSLVALAQPATVLPTVDSIRVQGTQITAYWTGDSSVPSYHIYLWRFGIVPGTWVVPGSSVVNGVGQITIDGSGLTAGQQYWVNVNAVTRDLTTPFPFTGDIHAFGSGGRPFVLTTGSYQDP